MSGVTAYLGLGSNLGSRRQTLGRALGLLQRPELRIEAVSSIYESAPLGPVPDQPTFLNLALRARTTLAPLALLGCCQQVEAALGRQRQVEQIQGPRTLDIDLLLLGQQVERWPELVLPHPRMSLRAFVVLPLLELDPRLTDPRDGSPLAGLLPSLSQQKIKKRGQLQGLTTN